MSIQQKPTSMHRSFMYWDVFEATYFNNPLHNKPWQLQFNRDVRAVRTQYSKEHKTHNVALCPIGVVVDAMPHFIPMPPPGLSVAEIQEYNQKYLEWRDIAFDAITYKKLYDLVSPYSTIHVLYMGEDNGKHYATYRVTVPTPETGMQLLDVTRDIALLMGWDMKTISRKNINKFEFIQQTHLKNPFRQV